MIMNPVYEILLSFLSFFLEPQVLWKSPYVSVLYEMSFLKDQSMVYTK